MTFSPILCWICLGNEISTILHDVKHVENVTFHTMTDDKFISYLSSEETSVSGWLQGLLAQSSEWQVLELQ